MFLRIGVLRLASDATDDSIRRAITALIGTVGLVFMVVFRAHLYGFVVYIFHVELAVNAGQLQHGLCVCVFA